jgi:hypothetical protein
MSARRQPPPPKPIPERESGGSPAVSGEYRIGRTTTTTTTSLPAVRVAAQPHPVTGATHRGPPRSTKPRADAAGPPLSSGRELHDLDFDFEPAIRAGDAPELDGRPSSHRTRVEMSRPSTLDRASPGRASPGRASPGRATPARATPARATPARATPAPIPRTTPAAMPAIDPHTDVRRARHRSAARAASRSRARPPSSFSRRRLLRGITPHRGRRSRAKRNSPDRSTLHNGDGSGLDRAARGERRAGPSVVTGPRSPFVLHFSV